MAYAKLNPRKGNDGTSNVGNATFLGFGNLNENTNGTAQQWVELGFNHNGGDHKTSGRIMGSNIEKISDLNPQDTVFVSLNAVDGQLMIDVLAKSTASRLSIDELGLDLEATVATEASAVNEAE